MKPHGAVENILPILQNCMGHNNSMVDLAGESGVSNKTNASSGFKTYNSFVL